MRGITRAFPVPTTCKFKESKKEERKNEMQLQNGGEGRGGGVAALLNSQGSKRDPDGKVSSGERLHPDRISELSRRRSTCEGQ